MNAKKPTPQRTAPDAKEQPQDDAAAPEPAAEPVAAPAAETAPAPAAEAPAGEAAAPQDEVAVLKDRLLRALAENENLLRRARREREETAKYAAANFARDMLTVADNLRRALDAIPESLRGDDAAVKSFIEGLELTERELLAALERHGIRKIEPMGERFNHDLHEAMFEVPTGEVPPGTVVQVIEDGYLIHDRLLRAARVGVAKALPAPDQSERVDTKA